MTPITNAPTIVPPIVPTPPAMEVPPSTDAAIAFISHDSPVFGVADTSWDVAIIPTTAEQKPENAYTHIFTLSTLIPESLDALSFPPMDNTCHPNGVFFKIRPATMAIKTRMTTPAGIEVPVIFRPNTSKPVFPSPLFPASFENVLPSERIFAKPLQIYIVPKVAINGATLNFVIIIPFTIPISAPIKTVINTIIGILKYNVTPKTFRVRPSSIKPPASIPASPAIEPTDKSMPPVMITYVIPIAKIPYRATCFATVRSAPALKKLFAVILKNISKITNTINVRPFKRVIANLLFPDLCFDTIIFNSPFPLYDGPCRKPALMYPAVSHHRKILPFSNHWTIR